MPGDDGADPAYGDPSVLAAGGGGIYSRSLVTVEAGSLLAKNSVLRSNVIGGGIASDAVTAGLIVSDSTIAGNLARGADGRDGLAGAAGVSGARGEIGADGDSGLRGLRGGDAAHGGDALGGGIYTRGTATIERTTVAANLADGGKGGRGGNGGAGGRGARESL